MVDDFSFPFFNGEAFRLVAPEVLELARLDRGYHVVGRLLLVVIELGHGRHGLGAQA